MENILITTGMSTHKDKFNFFVEFDTYNKKSNNYLTNGNFQIQDLRGEKMK